MATNIDGSRLGVPPGLEDAGNHVRRISQALAAELHALEAKLAPLEVEWKGDANLGFDALRIDWQRAAHALWGDEGAPMPAPGEPIPDGVDRNGPQNPDMGMLPFIAHALDKLYENYMMAEGANKKTWMMN
jgi:hypothetical protein